MKKGLYRKGLVFGVILLFVGAGVIPSTVGIKKEKANIQTIGSSGYIQGLIDNASDGDTIYIPSGTYYENIVINKSINLIGSDKQTTIIDGNNGENPVVALYYLVNISGFTIQNGGEYGIVIGGSFNIIADNIIIKNRYGVLLGGRKSCCNTIIGNTILSNDCGIVMSHSFDNNVIDNTISFCIEYGIHLMESSAYIKNNFISNCYSGVHPTGEWLPSSINMTNNSFINTGLDLGWKYSIFSKNDTVNDKPLVYLEEENDLIIENAGQIILKDCANITIQNQKISHTTVGIRLINSNNCTISDNIISHNAQEGIVLIYDLDLGPSTNNIISGNVIMMNNKNGIYSWSCDNNSIIDNVIMDNGYGIELYCNCYKSIVKDNYFYNNGLHINDYIVRKYNLQVENNIINGKPLVYLEDESDKIITDAGQIILVNCTNITAENQDLTNTYVGVQLIKTNNSIIIHNNCSNNLYGIKLSYSKNNIILDNHISSNKKHGILFYGGGNSYNNFSNNIINSNYDYGITNMEYWGSDVSNNIIKENIICSNNKIGIAIKWSENNTIKNNNIYKNKDCGIELFSECVNNSLIGNDIIDNGKFGIEIQKNNYHNSIKDNYIDLHWAGLIFTNNNYMYKCLKNNITGNNFKNNMYGIWINSSNYENRIYHNNFLNNNESARDEGNNSWDDGEYGNYWSEYEERYPNANKLKWKGIWDTPYDIEGGDNKDNYPLIKQWPDSRSRTTSRTQTIVHQILHWLLERFPLLERLLNIIFLKIISI